MVHAKILTGNQDRAQQNCWIPAHLDPPRPERGRPIWHSRDVGHPMKLINLGAAAVAEAKSGSGVSCRTAAHSTGLHTASHMRSLIESWMARDIIQDAGHRKECTWNSPAITPPEWRPAFLTLWFAPTRDLRRPM